MDVFLVVLVSGKASVIAFGTVRVLKGEGGEIWFVAKDVCDALELSNPTVAVDSLDEDERAKYCLGRQGAANIINESGLYSLRFWMMWKRLSFGMIVKPGDVHHTCPISRIIRIPDWMPTRKQPVLHSMKVRFVPSRSSTNPPKVVGDHCRRAEKMTITKRDGQRGGAQVKVINESGLYSLILRSRKPEAIPSVQFSTHGD